MTMQQLTDLLYAAVGTLAATNNWLVRYPQMNGPDENEYLEVIHIPNGPAKELLSTSNNLQGILKLGWYSEPNKGEVPTQKCDLICAAFPKGLRLFGTGFTVEFYRDPVINQPLPNGQNVIYPVTIYYRSFAN